MCFSFNFKQFLRAFSADPVIFSPPQQFNRTQPIWKMGFDFWRG
jgi:hypothetical protein